MSSSKFTCFLIILLIYYLQSSKCDERTADPARRAILRGTAAKLGEFPYVVNLISRSIRPCYGAWTCTGAILTRSWVVTGRHCFTNFPKNCTLAEYVRTTIRAGVVDLRTKTNYEQVRYSQHYVLTEKDPLKTMPDSYNHDVALIKVDKPFYFTWPVGPITIAHRPLPIDQKITCLVMGFGSTEEDLGQQYVKNKLLYYTFVTVDGDELSCRKRIPKTPLSKFGALEDWGPELVCVDPVHYDSSPCSGDSGGPLVCDGYHVGTSIGRTNAQGLGVQCGTKGNFHFYTFLAYYEDFLRYYIEDLPEFGLVTNSIYEHHGPGRSQDGNRDDEADSAASKHPYHTWLVLVGLARASSPLFGSRV